MGHKGITIGGRIVPKKVVPSSDKEFEYQKLPYTMNPELRSAPQINAEVVLGATAKSVGGEDIARGKIRVGSRVINRLPVALGKVLSGADYGGLSYNERLQEHRIATDGTLLRLANIFADKTGGQHFSSIDSVKKAFAKDVTTVLRNMQE